MYIVDLGFGSAIPEVASDIVCNAPVFYSPGSIPREKPKAQRGACWATLSMLTVLVRVMSTMQLTWTWRPPVLLGPESLGHGRIAPILLGQSRLRAQQDRSDAAMAEGGLPAATVAGASKAA